MTELHDVVVIGAGAMGSAAAWALSKEPLDVVVLEQFELGHAKGGSHGATRIFRVGTEQAHYLDMAERARGLWTELAAEASTDLLSATGAVEHGMTRDVADSFAMMLRDRAIDHALLDAEDACERWAGMRFDGPVLYQPGGAIIHADRVVAALQQLAASHGADVRTSTRVEGLDVSAADDQVIVHTSAGEVRAKRAVVTVGVWAPKVLGNVVALPTIRVTQEQPRLFAPIDPTHEWPCFVHWRDDAGEWGLLESYGLLEAGSGVKVGVHAGGTVVDPDGRDFQPEPTRDAALREYVQSWYPGLDPDRSTPISCVYDNTDNGDFIIDKVGPLTIATGFNGQGFKFVPLMGELLRDLALDRTGPPAMFTLARHLTAAPSRR